jgi:hypothetical protein
MGAPKKFNTELTDFSVVHKETTGPYAKVLEVDALVVGAGFGASPPFSSLVFAQSGI